MPIDPSVYGLQQPVKLNTPFENLGQMLQLRGQQQALQSAQALEQERRAKLAEDQRKQAEEDAYYQILSGPGTTDDRLEAIRRNPLTAKFYAPTLKSKLDSDKSAADTQKAMDDAAQAHATAVEKMQAHQAGQAQKVIAADYDPRMFLGVAQHEIELFKPLENEINPAIAQVRALQAQGAPLDQQKALVRQIMEGWGHSTPASSNAMTDAAKQAAEQPGQVAKSAQEQQIAATMQGGLTADQRSQLDQGAQRIALEGQRVGLEGQRVNLDKQRLAQTAPQAGDIGSDVRTTMSGIKYLDLGDYQTPKERSMAAAAAKAAGIQPVSKEVGASLAAADTAKQNITAMWSKIESKLPKTPDGRVIAGPANKLKQYFQTDDDLAAFNSWRAGAIQAVQALVEKGMGFRLNQAEINMIMQNDMPQVTDTVGAAKTRVNNMLTLLSNKEKTALTLDRSTLAGGGTTPAVEEWVRDPKTGQLVKKGGS